MRLNAVETLIEDQNYLINLQNVIDKFRDLEEIITLISNLNTKRNCLNRESGSIKSVETKIHKLFIIKHILSSIDSLKELIGVSESQLIRSFHDVRFPPSSPNLPFNLHSTGVLSEIETEGRGEIQSDQS